MRKTNAGYTCKRRAVGTIFVAVARRVGARIARIAPAAQPRAWLGVSRWSPRSRMKIVHASYSMSPSRSMCTTRPRLSASTSNSFRPSTGSCHKGHTPDRVYSANLFQMHGVRNYTVCHRAFAVWARGAVSLRRLKSSAGAMRATAGCPWLQSRVLAAGACAGWPGVERDAVGRVHGVQAPEGGGVAVRARATLFRIFR